MIRALLAWCLYLLISPLRLHLPHQSIPSLLAQPKQENVLASCKRFGDGIQREKDLAKDISEIYTMGEIPGKCSFGSMSGEEREEFLERIKRVQSQIVRLRGELGGSKDAKKEEVLKNLARYSDRLIECREQGERMKGVEGISPVIPVPVAISKGTEEGNKVPNSRQIVNPEDEDDTPIDPPKSSKVEPVPVPVPVSSPQDQKLTKEKEKEREKEAQFLKVKAEEEENERRKREELRVKNQQLNKTEQKIEGVVVPVNVLPGQGQPTKKPTEEREKELKKEEEEKKQKQRRQLKQKERRRANQEKIKSLEKVRLISFQKEQILKQRIKLARILEEKQLKEKLEKEIKEREEEIKQKKLQKEREMIEISAQMEKENKKLDRIIKLIAAQKQEQRQEKEKLKEAAAKVVNVTQISAITKPLPQPVTKSLQKIVQPIPVSMVPLDPSLLRKKKYVTNPLARNVIIDNQTELLKRYKKMIDDDVNNYESCPIEKPFFDGDQCIACKDYFNSNTRECTSCPPDTKYDEATRKCIKSIYVTNLNAENILIKERNIEDWKTLEDRLRSTSPSAIVECPLSTPYSINNLCSKCPDVTPYFDIVTAKCQKCPQKYKYDRTSRKCIIDQQKVQNNYLTNPSTHGLLVDSGTIQGFTANYTKLKLDTETKYQDCPAERPFFNGEECIGCIGDNKLFSVTEKKCTKCRDGFEYNYQFKSCLGTES